VDLGLQGKVVIVTGGASGIGAATVSALLAEGARPAVLDRSPAPPDLPAAVVWATADLASDAACEGAVAAVLTAHGRIDALVNNAGTNDGVTLGASGAAFRASLDRNLTHAFVLAGLCLPELVRNRGAIVNVSSKTAVTGQGATSAYVAAKAALLGLTREWAAALAGQGVRVNAVVPAEVETPMYTRWLDTFPDPAARKAEITARIPLGRRMTTPEEMAAAILFLLSERSAHTTGQWHFVDGGYTHLDRAL
jgi:L-fucose dehydrogenase